MDGLLSTDAPGTRHLLAGRAARLEKRGQILTITQGTGADLTPRVVTPCGSLVWAKRRGTVAAHEGACHEGF